MLAKTGTSHRLKPRLTDLITFGLIVMVLIIFAQVRYHDFVNYDDGLYVLNNPNIKDGLTWKGLAWAFTADLIKEDKNADRWQPLVFISRMIDIEIFGLNPGGHHVVNVWFHIVNTVFLFVLLRRMTGEIWKSAFVAAVFGIHPLQVEAVAWVTSRKDVLSTCLGFATIQAYLNYTDRPNPRKKDWVALFFALTLMSKSMMVTLPALLLLLDFWPLKRMDISPIDKAKLLELIKEKWLLFLLSFTSAIIAWSGQSSAFRHASPIYIAYDIPLAYFHYLGKTLAPFNLFIAGGDPTPSLPLWTSAVAWLVLILASLFIFTQRTKRIFLTVGWLWFLISLLPTIALTPHADRFMYTPIIGLGLLASWTIPSFVPQTTTWKRIVAFSSFVIMVALARIAWIQTSYWYDNVTLFEHAIKAKKENYLAQINLGGSLIGIRDFFELNPALIPKSLKGEYATNEDIGSGPEAAMIKHALDLEQSGKVDRATIEYKNILREYSRSKETYNRLGVALAKKEMYSRAARQFAKAFSIDKTYVDALFNLAAAFDYQDKPDRAEKLYRKVLELNPRHLKAHNNLGLILVKKKKWDEAREHYEKALEVDPKYGEAHYNLGLLLNTKTQQKWENFNRSLSRN